MKNVTKNEADIIGKLIVEAGSEEPSLHFTDELMKKIQVQSVSSIRYQPVLSKSFLLFIYSGVLVLLTVVILSGNSSGVLLPYLGEPVIMKTINAVILNLSSPLLLIIVLSGWLLFLLDKYIRQSFSTAN